MTDNYYLYLHFYSPGEIFITKIIFLKMSFTEKKERYDGSLLIKVNHDNFSLIASVSKRSTN